MSSGGFTLVDFSRPMRDAAITHVPVEPLLCPECKEKDAVYFDPYCDGCQDILSSPDTSIAQIFAVMRQWIPQVQGHMSQLSREVLRRGGHIDDRDGLSDMTLLMFAIKSGTESMGNSSRCVSLVELLLSKGARVDVRSRWCGMNPLHMAAFFNVTKVIPVLIEHCKDILNSKSDWFNGGTALHIAVANGNIDVIRELVSGDPYRQMINQGADPIIVNSDNKTPLDLLGEESEREDIKDCLSDAIRKWNKETATETVEEEVVEAVDNGGHGTSNDNHPNDKVQVENQDSVKKKRLENILKFQPGDRVIVGDQKLGTVRYAGETSFAEGLWYGVELDEAKGKNDGSVNGKRYFSCPMNRGIFAPPNKLSQFDGRMPLRHRHLTALAKQNTLTKKRQNSSPSLRRPSSQEETILKEGSTVYVHGHMAILRYIGETEFADGKWLGVEFKMPHGRNNGTVQNKTYFKCKPDHGLFITPSKATFRGRNCSELIK